MTTALSRNLTAQVFSQVVTIAIQLGMVPVLIAAWGVDEFGVWALLTAIPTFLAFSDFGFTFVAKNDMSMRVSAGDRAGALVTFQSIWVLLIAVVLVLSLTLIFLVYAVPLGRLFNLGQLDENAARQVLVLQIATALAYQFSLLFSAGVRCEGRAAIETMFIATGRLVEAGAIVVVALSGGGLVGAAIAALIARLFNVAFLLLWLRRTTPWLTLGFTQASKDRLAVLFWPSVNYMAVPFSNAILIQAPTVLLGAVGSPALVALYSVTRTVARMGMSAASMLIFSFTPEYSFAWGRDDAAGFKALLRKQATFLAILSMVYVVAAWWIVPWGVHLLSHGSIAPLAVFSMTMALAVFFEMLWTAAFSPLSAVNQHSAVSRIFLVAAVAAIAFAAFIKSPILIAASVALAHAATLLFSLRDLGKLRLQLQVMSERSRTIT